jgi:hypothetical protein
VPIVARLVTFVSLSVSSEQGGMVTDMHNAGTNKKLCPKLNGQWKELGMSPPAAVGTPTA